MEISVRTGIPYQALIDLDGDVIDAYVAVLNEHNRRAD